MIYPTGLNLTHFRSYEAASFTFPAAHMVFWGPNGVGKTNLLEALSTLCPGRALRGANVQEMQSHTSPHPWGVRATFCDDATLCVMREGNRRILSWNETPLKSQTQWPSYGLWLTPAMDQTLNESDTQRRRFLDRLVGALDPAHGAALLRYEKALRERNRLLAEGRLVEAWLDPLEAEMARAGAEIQVQRAAFLEALGRVAPFEDFPNPTFGLEEAPLGAPALKTLWAATRRQDQERGHTQKGPHRTKVTIAWGQKAAEACSTGEQKALLLSAVLNTFRLAQASVPVRILILDEVVAHLDPRRRTCLFQGLHTLNGVVWMSGTEEVFFKGFTSGAGVELKFPAF